MKQSKVIVVAGLVGLGALAVCVAGCAASHGPAAVQAPAGTRSETAVRTTSVDVPGHDVSPASAPRSQPAAPQGQAIAHDASKSEPIPDEKVKSIPKDAEANAAIDTGFQQWSSTWMFDRYIAGSARATDRGYKDGTYVIRGDFSFMRAGSRLTIPFAAAFTKPTDTFRLSNLCYNDVTTGMTDCIDPSDVPQGAALQSLQFLRSAIVVGLVDAMSAPYVTCVKHHEFGNGDTYYCHQSE
jgi:hypothetical protein